MSYLFLFVSILCNVAGQVLMKYAADSVVLPQKYNLEFFKSILSIPQLWIGVTFYFFGLITWLITLTKLELSVAYPFLALTYIFVFISSVLLFNESITAYKVIGFLLIISGIVIVSLNFSRN